MSEEKSLAEEASFACITFVSILRCQCRDSWSLWRKLFSPIACFIEAELFRKLEEM